MAVILLAGIWLLAGEFWRWMPTRAPVIAAETTDPVALAGNISSAHLFGVATAAPAAPAHAAEVGGDLKLLAVMAGTDGRGIAVISLGNKPAQAVPVGETLADGRQLVAVESDHIRLQGSTGTQDLPLPRAAPSALLAR